MLGVVAGHDHRVVKCADGRWRKGDRHWLAGLWCERERSAAGFREWRADRRWRNVSVQRSTAFVADADRSGRHRIGLCVQVDVVRLHDKLSKAGGRGPGRGWGW